VALRGHDDVVRRGALRLLSFLRAISRFSLRPSVDASVLGPRSPIPPPAMDNPSLNPSMAARKTWPGNIVARAGVVPSSSQVKGPKHDSRGGPSFQFRTTAESLDQ